MTKHTCTHCHLMEPIYSYVKGKGWIVSTARSVELRLRDGYARFEFRKPEIGERYTHNDKQEYLDLHLDRVRDDPDNYRIEYYQVWNERSEKQGFTHFLALIPL